MPPVHVRTTIAQALRPEAIGAALPPVRPPLSLPRAPSTTPPAEPPPPSMPPLEAPGNRGGRTLEGDPKFQASITQVLDDQAEALGYESHAELEADVMASEQARIDAENRRREEEEREQRERLESDYARNALQAFLDQARSTDEAWRLAQSEWAWVRATYPLVFTRWGETLPVTGARLREWLNQWGGGVFNEDFPYQQSAAGIIIGKAEQYDGARTRWRSVEENIVLLDAGRYPHDAALQREWTEWRKTHPNTWRTTAGDKGTSPAAKSGTSPVLLILLALLAGG